MSTPVVLYARRLGRVGCPRRFRCKAPRAYRPAHRGNAHEDEDHSRGWPACAFAGFRGPGRCPGADGRPRPDDAGRHGPGLHALEPDDASRDEAPPHAASRDDDAPPPHEASSDDDAPPSHDASSSYDASPDARGHVERPADAEPGSPPGLAGLGSPGTEARKQPAPTREPGARLRERSCR